MLDATKACEIKLDRTEEVRSGEKERGYKLWKEDLALVRELDLHYLRWGPANYKTFLGPGKYDWTWVDEVVAEMKRLGANAAMHPDFEPMVRAYAAKHGN